jgi:hypothetical protein
VERFERGLLAKLYNAGVPSERFIVSALEPTLRVANASVFRGISGGTEQNWEIYDNSALYAKLIYWALVRDCYSFINVVPVATTVPEGYNPVWINLDAQEPVIVDCLTAIANKSIVLIEERDFVREDWQAVYWLAKPGYRLDGPDQAEAQVFENSYLNWPGINVTVLGHGPAPKAPAPVVLSSNLILTFLTKLASRRNEWDSFMRGMYVAFDAIGLRYTQQQNDLFPIRSNLSYSNIYACQPADYNFMFQLLQIFPKMSDAHHDEVIAWTSLWSGDRIRTAVLYSAVLSSATTTGLYDLNITTQAMIEWGVGLETAPFVNEVFGSIFNTPIINLENRDVTMIKTPKKAFPLWLVCR